jgi:integrase
MKVDLLQDVGKKTVPQIERQRLTPEQMLRLLDVVTDPRVRGLIACAMNTGLRASEITTITVGDVDLARGELYIIRRKSASDDRLPITARLDGELRRWLSHYARELGNTALNPDMVLFPARHPPRLQGGNEPGAARIMRLGTVQPYKRIEHPQRFIQNAMKVIGFEVTVQEGLHTLRRSAARALFDHIAAHADEPGYDSALRTTASFLGHKSTVTTELYLGLSGDRKKRDAILRGHDFLPPDPTDNVVQLRAVP